MKYITSLDYVIFILFVVGGIWGAIKGFLDEVATKFGYVLGFLLALMFTHSVCYFFRDKAGFPAWFAAFIAYFLIFITGYLVMKVIGAIINNIVVTANLSVVDNILGFFLGLVEAFIIMAFFEYILGFQNLFNLQKYFDESLFSSKLLIPFANLCSSKVAGIVSGV